MGNGCLKPKTSVIVTSNDTFSDSERFATLKISNYLMHGFYCRNAQRIVHIPFFPPTCSFSPSQNLELETQLKAAMEKSSACIGKLIELGERFSSARTTQQMEEKILPFVTEHLSCLPPRVIKGYSILMMMAKLVS